MFGVVQEEGRMIKAGEGLIRICIRIAGLTSTRIIRGVVARIVDGKELWDEGLERAIGCSRLTCMKSKGGRGVGCGYLEGGFLGWMWLSRRGFLQAGFMSSLPLVVNKMCRCSQIKRMRIVIV